MTKELGGSDADEEIRDRLSDSFDMTKKTNPK